MAVQDVDSMKIPGPSKPVVSGIPKAMSTAGVTTCIRDVVDVSDSQCSGVRNKYAS